jgi:hypothetical protein
LRFWKALGKGYKAQWVFKIDLAGNEVVIGDSKRERKRVNGKERERERI